MQLSYAQRRTIKLYELRLVLLAAGAGVALALRSLPASIIDAGRLRDATGQLAESLGFLDFLLAVPPVAQFLEHYPKSGIALGGALFVGVPLAALLTERIHDWLLTGFDTDVLTPLRHSHVDRVPGGFVQLPWHLGTSGPRHDAWTQLCCWAAAGSGMVSGFPSRHFTAFTALVLAGQAGSGKSRMAGEFAYHLEDPGGDGGAAARRPRFRRAAGYIRRVLPFLARGRDDPWDAALLRPRRGEEPFDQFVARLASWRPRAATLLILDDPAPGQSRDVHAALAAASADYRHPVRLLIVNQTVPDSLYRYRGGEWMYEGEPAQWPPVVLRQEAWFSAVEVRQIAFASGVLEGKDERVRTLARERLHAVTLGNPLLVELGLEWLAATEDLEGFSVDRLRRQRVDRIASALEAAGLGTPSQLGQLALATLVGGASRNRIGREAASSDLFPDLTELPDQGRLRACFPADPLTGPTSAGSIPPVGPPLIGDAFVDHVVEQLAEEQARALVAAAFRIDPAVMVREIVKPRALGSPLAAMLGGMNPSEVPGLDPLDWAIGHAEVAVYVPLDVMIEWTRELQLEREQRAKRTIDLLNSVQRRNFLQRISQRACDPDQRPARHQYQPYVFLNLMLHATAKEGADFGAEFWVALLRSFGGWRILPVEPLPYTPDLHALEACGKAAAEDLDLSAMLIDELWHLQVQGVARLTPWRALWPSGDSALARARRHRLVAGEAAMRLSLKTYRSAVRELDAVVTDFPDDPRLQLEAVRARRDAAAAFNKRKPGGPLSPVLQARREARAIARAFPRDVAVQREAALITLTTAAPSPADTQSIDAESLDVVGDEIHALSDRFPDDPALSLLVARVNGYQARARADGQQVEDALVAEAHAGQAAEEAAKFPHEEIINLAAAEAWTAATYAFNQVPKGAEAVRAGRMAAAAEELATRWPTSSEMQAIKATARRFEAFAWSAVPEGAGLGELKLAAAAVIGIAKLFPADTYIQWQASMVLGYEATALALLPRGAGSGRMGELIESVARIAARFPQDLAFQQELARTYRCEAQAWAGVPGGSAMNKSCNSARRVVRLALGFPEDSELREEAVHALKYAAYAGHLVPLGSRAHEVQQIAVEIDGLAAPFRFDRRIQSQAAAGWAFAVAAWSNRPEGRGGEAEAAAARLLSIANRFPRVESFQETVAEAMRAEALAWSRIDKGEGGIKASVAARRATAIARAFPNNRKIQVSACIAGEFETRAWCSGRSAGTLVRAREAVDRLKMVAEAAASVDISVLGHWYAARTEVQRAVRLIKDGSPEDRS